MSPLWVAMNLGSAIAFFVSMLALRWRRVWPTMILGYFYLGTWIWCLWTLPR